MVACLAMTTCADLQGASRPYAVNLPKASGQEVEIPFVRQSGVRDWRPVDDRHVLLQGDQGQWYLVTLQAPSLALAYAEAIGFDTLPSGALARLGALIIQGIRHPIASVVKAEAPGKAPRE